MRVRTAIARTARRATLTAVGWGVLTILVSVAISACTSSPPTTSVFEPSYNGNTSTTGTDGAPTVTTTATATATASTPAPPTGSPSPLVTITVTVTPPPSVAPVTGGGGTAGVQDGVLFAIGGAAILAGAASIIYRRKVTKDR